MNFEVVIVGGGIVGLTCALELIQKNIKVAIIESKIISNDVGESYLSTRFSAINARSVQILESLGIWSKILNTARTTVFTDIKISDQNSEAKIHFSAREFSLSNLGFIVDNQTIIIALKQKLDQSEIVFFNPDSILDIQKDNEELLIQLASGKKISSKLLIGADGTHSFVRNFFQFDYYKYSYGQQAIIANIKTNLPHKNTAYQKFLTSGVIAFLPLYHSQCYSVVWSEATSKAKKIMAMNKDKFQEELKKNFGTCLGELTVLSKRIAFPLIEQHVHKYYQSGIVLIGDAAHTLHLLAGQGLNLSLADVQILTRIIIATKKTGRDYRDISTLSKFEKERRIENTIMIKLMGNLKSLFCNDLFLSKNLRSIGCNIICKSKLLKRFLIYQAMGKW